MRSQISEWLGNRLSRAIARRALEGRIWQTTFRMWNTLPRAARDWLNWRPLPLAEQIVRERLVTHPVIGQLIIEERNTVYAMSPLAAALLINSLERRRPRAVVEFGSGLSTCILAAHAHAEVLRDARPPRIVSFEHDEAWLQVTSDRLSRLQLRDYVELKHAPLTTQSVLGRELTAYQISELGSSTDQPSFDMCIIDGPPDPIGRAGSLAVVANYLSARALVLLDDAFRTSEQAAIREWQRFFCGSLTEIALVPTSGRGVMTATWCSNKN